MSIATVTKGFSADGAGASRRTSVEYNHPNPYKFVLPAGKTVTAWVKTDSDTAACNLPAGHGYSNGTFDVYWAESGVNKRRYGVPGTISTNALSLDGGTGDAFPASATTGVIVTKQVAWTDMLIDASRVQILAVTCAIGASGRASINFQQSDGTSIVQMDVTQDADAKPIVDNLYDIANGDTNPFGSTDVEKMVASNGTTTAGTLDVFCGELNTDTD